MSEPTFREKDIARFWRMVDRGRDDECWVWRGAKFGRGYGCFSIKAAAFSAHRFSAAISGLAIGGKCVLHKCDNPPCVNPRHLWIGTRGDNARDCVRKRRHTHGERVGSAKLTRADVLEIKRRLRRGASGASLGRKYGVSRSRISEIKNGKTWAHVAEVPNG